MKRSLFIVAALITASPAFAHADGHFHTHGVEISLVLVAVAAGMAILASLR